MVRERQTVLLVEDDELLCDTLEVALRDSGYEVLKTTTLAAARTALAEHAVDAALLDQRLPDGEGDHFCGEILGKYDHLMVVMMTAYPSLRSAVVGVKAGAFDYVSKPFELSEVLHILKNAMRQRQLETLADVATYRRQKIASETVVVGQDAGLSHLAPTIARAAESDASVLITGETGTGKSLLARAIHLRSARHDRPFLSVNCATLPEGLIESELFGYERGAFTGAAQRKRGLFQLADHGSLLLDEIGLLPPSAQAKLLGVLEDGLVRRLGSERTERLDVRVMAATNTDLQEAVKRGEFRADLFYRLDVLGIVLPPLRERPADLLALCEHFLCEFDPQRSLALPPGEHDALASYRWPGNVRELRNVLERSVLMAEDGELRPSQLLVGSVTPASPPPDEAFPTMKKVEMEHLQRALHHFEGNLTHAADALDISLSTLKRRIKQLNLRRS